MTDTTAPARADEAQSSTPATAVLAWLRRERVSFMRDGKGRPITTEEALQRRLETKRKCSIEPNFDPAQLLPGRHASRR